MGGYHRADRNRLHGEIAGMRYVSASCRAAPAACRLDVGWRTADAGDRPSARCATALPVARRADTGLAPILVEEIGGIVRRLAADGMTILLAEQNAAMALSVGDRAYVLKSGRISLAGTAASLRESEEVRRKYLRRRTRGSGLTPLEASCMPDISHPLGGRRRIVPAARSEADHDSRASAGD
jgi:branched-chain amino acid transport system ATP-binding protein